MSLNRNLDKVFREYIEQVQQEETENVDRRQKAIDTASDLIVGLRVQQSRWSDAYTEMPQHRQNLSMWLGSPGSRDGGSRVKKEASAPPEDASRLRCSSRKSSAPFSQVDERAPTEWHAVPVTTNHWRHGRAAEGSASLGTLEVEVTWSPRGD